MGLFRWLKNRKHKEEVEDVRRHVSEHHEKVDALQEAKGKEFVNVEETVKEKTERKLNEEHFPLLYDKFSDKLGIKLEKKDYPKVVLDDSKGTSYSNFEAKIIGIHSSSLNDLPVWGEEIAHYFRKKMRKDKGEEEKHSAEFFGFLGRKITSGFWNKEYVADKKTEGALNKKQVLETIKANKSFVAKERKSIVEGFLKGDKEVLHKRAASGDRETEIRNDLLTHHRPYDFASKVDLSKIHNWKKFFSMPDREVRHRFFTPNPDYSGL